MIIYLIRGALGVRAYDTSDDFINKDMIIEKEKCWFKWMFLFPENDMKININFL